MKCQVVASSGRKGLELSITSTSSVGIVIVLHVRA